MAAAAATSSLSFPALLPTRSLPSRHRQQRRRVLPTVAPSAARGPHLSFLARRQPDATVLPRRLPNLRAPRAIPREEGDDGRGTPAGSAEGEASAGGGEIVGEEEVVTERMGRERVGGGGGDVWGGVGEEVREIEWPALGKVVGTTGVVLAVIAGSSVALLTVNAVLAELSDRVFAGRGVQDFFG